jgi:hypothetical protein
MHHKNILYVKFHIIIVDKKYFHYIIIVTTVISSFVLTFIFKKIITTSETYIILPIWFLFSEIGFNYFKDHTKYKNPTLIIVFISIISFIVTFIFLIISVKLNKFQAIEDFTLFTSIAGILFTFQQDFIKIKN